MENMNRLGKSVNLLAVIAIASVGMIAPAIAGTDITISQESLKLAQASPSPRRSPATAPSPTSSPVTSPSPRRSPVTAPSPTNSPATTPSPTSSPVTAPSPTTSSPATTTSQNLCRRVVKPSQGLVIRREPGTQAAVVGGVAYQGRVTLTTNPPTVKTVANRDWVEISTPARGWISTGMTTETASNLAYCP